MTNALTIYNQTKDLLKAPATIDRFKEVLGERAQAFLASVLSIVYQDDKLQECEPQSVLISAMKAAVLDLPVDPNIGHSAIIPYKNRATFQIMYKGIVRLALRTKEYDVINADCVYEGEKVIKDRLTGRIIINGGRSGDKIIGAFAYFKLKDGFEKFLYMTVEELEAHGKRYSPSYDYDRTLWKSNKEAMYKKTVLKLLLLRFGPLSIDVKKVLEEDKEPEEVVEGESQELPQEETGKAEETKTRAKKGHSEPKVKLEEPPNNAPTEHSEPPTAPQTASTISTTPPDNFNEPEPSQQEVINDASQDITDPVVAQYGEKYWIDHKKFKDYTWTELKEKYRALMDQLKTEKNSSVQLRLISATDALKAVYEYRLAHLQP